MTLGLANLAAFSVQLVALVGTGAVVVALLRVHAPMATLRFWQVVFASTFLWPLYQLAASTDARVIAPPNFLSASSTGAAVIRDGLAALDARAAIMVSGLLACGAAIRLMWLVLGLRRLRSIRAASRPADVLSSLAASLQHDLGVSADIRFSDDVDSPATIGARRPIVLLPPHLSHVASPIQRAVLCHELIHVQRRDWLPSLLEELWCAIFWFHPGARALTERLSLARETVVDAATIGHTRDRRAYAAALLEFSTARPRVVGTTPFIRRRHLERRLALIAQEVAMSRSSLAVRLSVAASVVALATTAATSHAPLSTTLQAQTEKVYEAKEGSGISLPRVIREVKPGYTPQAMRARIQGAVWLSVVVLSSGDVGEVIVTRSLDKEHGLDEQAIAAARQWKFLPGTREGKPVAVEVTIEMTFTLKK